MPKSHELFHHQNPGTYASTDTIHADVLAYEARIKHEGNPVPEHIQVALEIWRETIKLENQLRLATERAVEKAEQEKVLTFINKLKKVTALLPKYQEITITSRSAGEISMHLSDADLLISQTTQKLEQAFQIMISRLSSSISHVEIREAQIPKPLSRIFKDDFYRVFFFMLPNLKSRPFPTDVIDRLEPILDAAIYELDSELEAVRRSDRIRAYVEARKKENKEYFKRSGTTSYIK